MVSILFEGAHVWNYHRLVATFAHCQLVSAILNWAGNLGKQIAPINFELLDSFMPSSDLKDERRMRQSWNMNMCSAPLTNQTERNKNCCIVLLIMSDGVLEQKRSRFKCKSARTNREMTKSQECSLITISSPSTGP